MKRYIISSILLILFFFACNLTKTEIKLKDKSIKEMASVRYVNNYRIIYNNANDFALVTKNHKEITQSIPDLYFFIISIKTLETVIEDTLNAGDVYWFNDYAIRATVREQKAESRRRIYTYDVKFEKFIPND